MAASRAKYRGKTRSALKVSRRTWFHWRTTSADGRQRPSSGSRCKRHGWCCRPRLGGAQGLSWTARGRRGANMGFSSLGAVCGIMTRTIVPGAQTERRGEAGPVRVLLGGGHAPAAFLDSPLLSPLTPHEHVVKSPKRSSPPVEAWLPVTWACVNGSRHATPPAARYSPPPSPSPALPPLPAAPPVARLSVMVLPRTSRVDPSPL